MNEDVLQKITKDTDEFHSPVQYPIVTDKTPKEIAEWRMRAGEDFKGPPPEMKEMGDIVEMIKSMNPGMLDTMAGHVGAFIQQNNQKAFDPSGNGNVSQEELSRAVNAMKANGVMPDDINLIGKAIRDAGLTIGDGALDGGVSNAPASQKTTEQGNSR